MTALLAFWNKLDLWIQVWCVSLIVLFLGVLAVMLQQLRSTMRRSVRIVGALAVEPSATSDERRFGRTQVAFEKITQAMVALGPEHAHLTDHVSHALEPYDSAERTGTLTDTGKRYFLTRPAAELVTSSDAWDGYPASFYRAVPGVLTSLGLLGTFLALLVGLDGLVMLKSGTVDGLAQLIRSLSGKFLTSIVALALSVLFLLVEVLYCQPRLRRIREAIVRAISQAFPLLTQARILLDLQRNSVKQATALGHISADVVDKFANVFRDDLAPLFAAGISSSMANQLQAELGPTLHDLRGAMQSLTATVERLEQGKQESVVGEIHVLVGALERTMRETLGDMGKQFQDALSGSTKNEFGELANVIKGSAAVVGEMNAGLVLVQSTLQSVADSAKQSSSEQMAAGYEQTQRLNTLVEGLMLRLNDTASQNYDQMSGTLTLVVTALSEKVTQLSDDLVKTVGAATERSQDAATHTLQQANDWSTTTREQIAELLASLRDKSERFDKAGDTLLEAQGLLQGTLDQNHKALAALATAAGEVKTYTTGLAGVQRQLGEGQQAQLQVATIARESIAKLAEAGQRHEEFLAKYHATFEQYRGVFEGMDQEIGRTLETILERLQSYNRSVESNFKAIVDSANVVMPRMASVLKVSTDELKEHLDELSDVIEKSTARLTAARPA